MSQWWQCPRCGRRLSWSAVRVWCSNRRCGYDAQLPTTSLVDDTEAAS